MNESRESGASNICPSCKKHVMQHMHDTAHGIPNTHIIGSERYECKCGFNLRYEDNESEGFVFILDKLSSNYERD